MDLPGFELVAVLFTDMVFMQGSGAGMSIIGKAIWIAVGFVLVCDIARAEAVTLLVPATSEWFDTGIVLGPDEKVLISASGVWTNGGAGNAYSGPNGFVDAVRSDTIMPSAQLGALIGRIGKTVFPVGSYSDPVLEGRLFLTMNDVPNTYSDNSGYLVVTIDVESCSPTCEH